MSGESCFMKNEEKKDQKRAVAKTSISAERILERCPGS